MHRSGPPRSRLALRTCGVLIFAISICAASGIPSRALAQQVVETPDLGMTGWGEGATTIDTATLGMTGWREDATTVETATLRMTGWRTDPVILRTPALGMTGWRSGPIRSRARAINRP